MKLHGEDLSNPEVTNLQNGNSKKLLQDDSVMNQMQGEFAIIKGYGKDDVAYLWAVTNPHKPNK